MGSSFIRSFEQLNLSKEEDGDQICLPSKPERAQISPMPNFGPKRCSTVCHLSRRSKYPSRPMRAHNNRSFLLRTYPTMKKHNPHTPILIREASNTQPKVWARYGVLQLGRDIIGITTNYI